MTASRFNFRAWDGERMRSTAYGGVRLDIHGGTGLWMMWQDIKGGELLCSSDKFTLMQSTGLLDKSGVEIFEGDIVECDMSFKGGFLPHAGEIVWEGNYAAFATRNDAGETLLHNHLGSSFEVIGNIHENPELLK